MFLGFANFYWRFIQGFNYIITPLISKLKTTEGNFSTRLVITVEGNTAQLISTKDDSTIDGLSTKQDGAIKGDSSDSDEVDEVGIVNAGSIKFSKSVKFKDLV